MYDPEVNVYREGDKLYVTLSNPLADTEIYFTIDNTYPVQFGSKYERAILIPEGNLSLRARTFRKGEPLGRELIIPRTELEKRAK